MQDLWRKAHLFVLECKVGDYYMVGDDKIACSKRTKNRVWFTNGICFTIRKFEEKFFYFTGKNINNTLRDIEGYFVYLIHSNITF